MTLKLRTKVAAGVLALSAATTVGVVAVNGQGSAAGEPVPGQNAEPAADQSKPDFWPAGSPPPVLGRDGVPRIDTTTADLHAEVDGATFIAGRRIGTETLCLAVKIPSGETMAGCPYGDFLTKGTGYIVQHEGTGTKTVYGIAPRGATTVRGGAAQTAVTDGAYVLTVPAGTRSLTAIGGPIGEVTISIPGSQI